MMMGDPMVLIRTVLVVDLLDAIDQMLDADTNGSIHDRSRASTILADAANRLDAAYRASKRSVSS